MSERNANTPSNFDRLAQGSAARDAMIARVMSMASTPVDAQVTVAVTDPVQFSSRRSRRASVFATGALGALSIGAAALAACGGGDSRSTGTPEGGVKGEAANPGGGSSPIVVKTEAMPSATAVIEAPTATVEAQLTQEQADQISSQVESLITDGLSNPDSKPKLTDISISQAGGDGRYLDPEYTKKAIANCKISNFGKPFYSVNLDKTVDPSASNYASTFLINCAQPADVSKALFKATGDPVFRQANEDWKKVHKAIFEAVHANDPKDWNPIEQRYYIPQ